MIVLVRHDAAPETVEELLKKVRAMGLEPLPLDGRKGRAFEVVGGERGRVLALRDAPGVAEILTRRVALAGGEPVWPHFALRVTALLVGLLAVLVLLTAWFPPGLGDAAERTHGPGAVEWYLRPLDAFLALFPAGLRWIGGSLFLLFWLSVIFWPFVDRADTRTPGGRRIARLVRVLGVLLLVLITLLGLRGAP